MCVYPRFREAHPVARTRGSPSGPRVVASARAGYGGSPQNDASGVCAGDTTRLIILDYHTGTHLAALDPAP
jgi:hypothetical protein